MSSSASRKTSTSRPQVATADDAVLVLLKELIIAQLETNTRLAAIENNTSPPPAAQITVDAAVAFLEADMLTTQQAAPIAGRVERTIIRWSEEADTDISFVLGGKLFISKSKLLAHIERTTHIAKKPPAS